MHVGHFLFQKLCLRPTHSILMGVSWSPPSGLWLLLAFCFCYLQNWLISFLTHLILPCLCFPEFAHPFSRLQYTSMGQSPNIDILVQGFSIATNTPFRNSYLMSQRNLKFPRVTELSTITPMLPPIPQGPSRVTTPTMDPGHSNQWSLSFHL